MLHRAQLSLFDFDQPFGDAASPEVISSGSGLRSLTSEAEMDELLALLAKHSTRAISHCGAEPDISGLIFYFGDGPAWYLDIEANKDSLERLVNALSTMSGYVIAHDAKSLLHGLQRLGAPQSALAAISFVDVMVAAHLCHVPTADLSLHNLVTHVLGSSDLSSNGHPRKTQSAHRSGITNYKTISAAVRDVGQIWALHQALKIQLTMLGVASLFHDVEMPLLSVLFEMEAAGVAIDLPYLAALSHEIGKQITQLETVIFGHAGHTFNVGSPQQLSRVLFDELKLPTDKLHKTWRAGNVSTSAWSLEEIKDLHPIIGLVLEHRELTKLKGTYCDAFPELIDPHDHLLRTTFQQVNTVTGRLSSTQPNLQNIPITSEMGRRVRQAFVSRWGGDGCIISADYSQVELRILAHLADDAALVAAFERGEDIHARTAANVYQVPIEEVTTEQRGHAKKINFGIAYGMGAASLAGNTGMSLQAAQDFINRYFRGFPALHRWVNQIKREASAKGYVTTLMGRRRNLPRLLVNSGASKERRARAEREAMNTPVQGSAADLIKVAMIKLQKRLKAEGLMTKMVLQVHDELVFDVPVGEVEAASRIIREEMCNAYPLKAKLDIDLGVGANWDAVESKSL
ncbi:MAG: hypothetical protein HC853_00535 [Anaerolineae bacterium]|nr:hypothetical protein [Anaerolineae bacterium]